MVKYEAHFQEEDKNKLHKRLRFFYVVSDLNSNAALNDQREVNWQELGIELSTRTVSLRPWRRGRGRSGPLCGGGRGRGGGNTAPGGGAGREGANAYNAPPPEDEISNINIGTILRYPVSDAESPVSPLMWCWAPMSSLRTY